MLDGRSRGPSLTLGMTDDFCHSERSRGISNHPPRSSTAATEKVGTLLGSVPIFLLGEGRLGDPSLPVFNPLRRVGRHRATGTPKIEGWIVACTGTSLVCG
jgi:hypothetical protein